MKDREKNAPIAVIDSGVGGISVLRELLKVMPNENYIYYGDSLNAPYGTKKLEEVRQLTVSLATSLFEEGAKGLVVACNTATSAAVRVLREMFPEIPIVGIEPALKPAVEAKEGSKVLVMATPITIREEKFQRLMSQYEDRATIYPLACPGLMEFVEQGILEGSELIEYLEQLLMDYKETGLDGVVLGCTHYPFIKKSICEVLGNGVNIYDGGAGTAKEMRRRLTEAKLISDNTKKGVVDFRNSLPEPQEKINLCIKLLGGV